MSSKIVDPEVTEEAVEEQVDSSLEALAVPTKPFAILLLLLSYYYLTLPSA